MTYAATGLGITEEHGVDMAGQAFRQRSLRRVAVLEGVGLHSGRRVTLRLVPAPSDHGLVFARVDLPGRPEVPLRPQVVLETAFATTIGVGAARVGTVEHLLAALNGLGIDNLRLELDGPEVPILDGSAAPFVRAVSEAGILEQAVPKSLLVVRRPVTVRDGDKHATIAPSRRLRIECAIDFEHPTVADQRFALEFDDRTFAREVAPARTFGFLRDVERLRAMGLARGGSLENAVVLDERGVLNAEGLRFPDEFVRHKVLDALGDLALAGRPILGALVACKTGHALNQRLVAALLGDPENYAVVRAQRREVQRAQLDVADLIGVLAPLAA